MTQMVNLIKTKPKNAFQDRIVMKDEGAVGWSMEKAKAELVLLQAAKSRLNFENMSQQDRYCKWKLRCIERFDAVKAQNKNLT